MIRPKQLRGRTTKVNTGCGTLYITLNTDEENSIKGIFVSLGKSGSCSKASNEAIARCISTGLQNGVVPEVFIKSLKGIRCDRVVVSESHITSCADAIAKCLEDELNNKGENT